MNTKTIVFATQHSLACDFMGTISVRKIICISILRKSKALLNNIIVAFSLIHGNCLYNQQRKHRISIEKWSKCRSISGFLSCRCSLRWQKIIINEFHDFIVLFSFVSNINPTNLKILTKCGFVADLCLRLMQNHDAEISPNKSTNTRNCCLGFLCITLIRFRTAEGFFTIKFNFVHSMFTVNALSPPAFFLYLSSSFIFRCFVVLLLFCLFLCCFFFILFGFLFGVLAVCQKKKQNNTK